MAFLALRGISYAVKETALFAERHEVELLRRSARIAGVIRTSLYDAIAELGESPLLAGDFAAIFAWDVDFSRTVQPGDEFGIVYERLYRSGSKGEDEYVRPGRILAARYNGSSGLHTAIFFEPSEGKGGYYRSDGTSVERQFMVAPLKYSRISSSYSHARKHPILKVTRPHPGIDYAASHGTPVWSVADGKVIHAGWAGGFGRLVKIQHANGYVSYYGHLSSFAKGLKVGKRVRQQEVIGKVGKTGLATGPHVCFRVAKDGTYVNPAKLRSPPADPIASQHESAFQRVRDQLLAELDPTPTIDVGEAL